MGATLHPDRFSPTRPWPGSSFPLGATPYDPSRGLRANPAKPLIDPYAKAVDGEVEWGPAVYPTRSPGTREDTDSAAYVPKAVVTNPFFDWAHDRSPRTPWHETVLYELRRRRRCCSPRRSDSSRTRTTRSARPWSVPR